MSGSILGMKFALDGVGGHAWDIMKSLGSDGVTLRCVSEETFQASQQDREIQSLIIAVQYIFDIVFIALDHNLPEAVEDQTLKTVRHDTR